MLPRTTLSANQPGQMTTVMQSVNLTSQEKILRVGIVIAGKIVEERVFKQPCDISIGSSEHCTFVVLSELLPSNHVLFVWRNGQYCLRFFDLMQGRIVFDEDTEDLDTLSRLADRSDSGVFEVPLTCQTHGKVNLGGIGVLFNFVNAPSSQPKPHLPAGVRDGVLDRIDWRMTIFASFSFLFHFALVGALYSDWGDSIQPADADIRAIVEQVSSLKSPIVEEPQPTETQHSQGSTAATTKSPHNSSARPAARNTTANQGANTSSNGASRPANAERLASMFNQLSASNSAVVAAVSHASGSSRGVLEGEVPTGPLDQFARSDEGVNDSPFGKIPQAGQPIEPGQSQKNLSELGQKSLGQVIEQDAGKVAKVAGPKATVTQSSSWHGGKVSNSAGTLAGAKAMARSCYLGGLGQNSEMEGSVAFTLVVGPSGKVSQASTSASGSISSSVNGCVKGVLSGLQFDAPEGGNATVTGSFTFLNANKGK